MRKSLLTIFLVSLTVSAMSQALSLQSSPSTLKILPGEPVTFQLIIRNSSGRSLRLIGTNLEHALAPTGSQLVSPSGGPLSCSPAAAVSTVTSKSSPCEGPTVIFPKDGTVTIASGIYSQKACPLQDVPPGRYAGRVSVQVQACDQGSVQVLQQTLDIPVLVEVPQGQDAAYLAAIDKAARQANTKLRGPYSGTLKWMEVLHSRRIHSEQIALSHFPTSTYAGYALMKMGPAGSLTGSVNWSTKTPRQRDVAWLVPSAASADKQDAKRQHVRGGLQSFVEKTQAFLAMHPDFARADILRKEMANALFQLDQRDAALEQVEKLSKMKGPVAEEAQAVMTKLKKPSQQPK